MQRFFFCNCQNKKVCMKNLLIVVIVSLIICSCNRVNIPNPISVSLISGKWELREVVGGFCGRYKI